jgi:hypothetical protein
MLILRTQAIQLQVAADQPYLSRSINKLGKLASETAAAIDQLILVITYRLYFQVTLS